MSYTAKNRHTIVALSTMLAVMATTLFTAQVNANGYTYTVHATVPESRVIMADVRQRIAEITSNRICSQDPQVYLWENYSREIPYTSKIRGQYEQIMGVSTQPRRDILYEKHGNNNIYNLSKTMNITLLITEIAS